ncbi:MAG: hypothetical protein NXI20_00860 [bacterium]|nr:hypothetical protein [bacterium]
MNCPNCSSVVDPKDVNIKTDLAKCGNCFHIFKISEHVLKEPIRPVDDGFDMANPPNGAWMRREINSLVLGATTRSPIAFFLVPFMIIWSGGSLGGIYGSQIASGEFDMFLSLFGIPFLLGSIVFWSLALMAVWGKVEVTMDRYGGKVFTGLGNMGYTRKFAWDEISVVREGVSRSRNKTSHHIILEGKKRISFGTGVSSSRIYFLKRSLQEILGQVRENRNFV